MRAPVQLDTAERGFSFQQDGRLDMRMGPGAKRSAEDILNAWSEIALRKLLFDYGELGSAYTIAKQIAEVGGLLCILEHRLWLSCSCLKQQHLCSEAMCIPFQASSTISENFFGRKLNACVQAREQEPILTTQQLRTALGRPGTKHSGMLALVFQVCVPGTPAALVGLLTIGKRTGQFPERRQLCSGNWFEPCNGPVGMSGHNLLGGWHVQRSRCMVRAR